MKKALISSLAFSSLLWGMETASAVNLIIDDFAQPLQDEILLSPTGLVSASSLDTGLSLSSVIGGTRTTTLTLLEPLSLPEGVDPPDNDFDETSLTSGGATGVLDQSISGLIGNFSQATVTWNGGTGLGENFSEFDRFRLNVNLFDLFDPTTTEDIGTVTLRVRNSLTGAFSTSSLTLDQINTPTNLDFLFSGFSNPSAFNSSIAEIQLEIGTLAQPGLLFTLEDLVAVPLDDGGGNGGGTDIPEPSLVLACLTLAGTQMVITGWRKSRPHKNKH
jgi:hypothetical protein